MNDQGFMELALSLAQTASSYQEVPVGAVIVQNTRIISTGFNRKELTQNPIYHAEIIAIEKAAEALGRWRLDDCQLYVTLEPCLMCAGALWQSRIQRVIFGTPDPKGGGLGSLYSLHEDRRLNHNYDIDWGIRGEQCAHILKSFFQKRRRRGC